MKTSFDWIVDNKDGISLALKIIAGGFAALKIATLGLNITMVTTAANDADAYELLKMLELPFAE